jgi:(R,R)-butanediol dehydrogenase/meso-butanediol dehydrogenase/diacetyl reductase
VRAVTLTSTPPELALAEVADPVPAPDGVVLAVTACGICGSDLHVAGVIGAPGTILGHEIAGVVEAVGPEVGDRWRPGQAVAVRPTTGCGTCAECTRGRPDHCRATALLGLDRPGGFAEHVAVAARDLFALPTALSGPEQALVEPLAVARRALRRADLQPGEAVSVIGAGPVGLAVIAWARALGAGVVVASDPSASRRQLALDLGADAVVDPGDGDLGAATVAAAGAPSSVVVECSGRPEQIGRAMDHCGVDGRVVVLGVCLAEVAIVPWIGLAKELDVRFSLYYEPRDFTDTIGALEDDRLVARAMLTETIGLAELPDRFARLRHEPHGGKVVVLPA